MAKKGKPGAMRQRSQGDKKQRTREHVIADCSFNHVERLVLKCGFTVQRVSPDYGYDLRLETFDDQGGLEDEHVSLQLKATDSASRYALVTQECFSFPISTKDYHLWSKALMPVFLVLYDAQIDEAYWLHIQEWKKTFLPDVEGDTLNVHIPQINVLGVQTIRMMRQRKKAVIELVEQMLRQATTQKEI